MSEMELGNPIPVDYEKKHKEEFVRATQLLERGDITRENLIYIFPELKESEDEKVKRILHSISCKMSFHLRDIFTEEEFQCFDTWSFAWLKKQGKHKDYYTKQELIDMGFSFTLNGDIVTPDKMIEDMKNEKQGKEEYALKSFKDEDVRKFMQYIEKEAKAYEFNLPNRGYDIYAFAKDILAWLEKQGNKLEEYVFRPTAGCTIDEAAQQAVDKAANGENIVFSFNGFYIKIYKDTTINNIINSYNDFCKKQCEKNSK